MTSLNRISFYGGETAGSPAYLTNSIKNTENQPVEQSQVNNPNFRGYDSYESQEKKDKKAGKAVAITVGTLAAAALIIGGLGYAHKVDVLSNLKDGKFKDVLKKIEPAAEKCYDWCHTVKSKGNEWLESIKKFFNSKKS